MTSQQHILVRSLSDVDMAADWLAQGYGLVAGSVRVATLLEDQQLACVNGEDLLNPAAQHAVMQSVSASAELFDVQSGAQNLPVQLRTVAGAEFLRTIYTIRGMKACASALGHPMLVFGSGELHAAHIPSPVNPQKRSGQPERFDPAILDDLKRTQPTANWELDLVSLSGKKLDNSVSQTRRIGLRIQDKPPVKMAASNFVKLLYGRITGQGYVRGIRIPSLTDTPDMFTEVLDRCNLDADERTLVQSVLHATSQAFFEQAQALREILKRFGHPKAARFDHVTLSSAGFVYTLDKARVPCSMSSHGCMVTYGQGPRHRLAGLLGRSVYNHFPSMAQLEPRSPLQTAEAPDGVKIVKRVRVSEPRPRSSEAFHIYAAPNFLSWHVCFWGLSLSCFDTLQTMTALASTVAKSPNVTVDLRIKTTPRDVAKASARPFRGLLPEDTAHLIDPANGVHDASAGSHSEYMKRADLVITEGVTAVTFEALERRIPLLLLLPSEHIDASLPSLRLPLAKGDQSRSAVYSCVAGDELHLALEQIHARHDGADLSDAEVAPFVWTQE